MAIIDLDELRKEIEHDRKRLSDKESVLRYLEEREGIKGASPTNYITVNTPTPSSGFIPLDQLIPDTGRRTLLDDVKDVVSRFGSQEFTVVHVDVAMKQQGIDVKGGKFSRSRISTVLSKLEDQGVIVKTHKGGGNIPNQYKLKEVADNDLL